MVESKDRQSFWFGILVLLVAVAVLPMMLSSLKGEFHPIAFDSEKWKSKDHLEQRQDMIADLELNYPLIGRTESEVMALLGQPSEVLARESVPNSGCDQAWEYRMGPSRGFKLGPDVERFVVGFVGGRVAKTWQYAD
jgi:hypothetical protein